MRRKLLHALPVAVTASLVAPSATLSADGPNLGETVSSGTSQPQEG